MSKSYLTTDEHSKRGFLDAGPSAAARRDDFLLGGIVGIGKVGRKSRRPSGEVKESLDDRVGSQVVKLWKRLDQASS